MKFLKTYEALTQEQLENRRKEALFKKEVWKKIPKEDQDKLISMRYNLSNLRDEFKYLSKRGNDVSDTKKKITRYKKIIRELENKYYDKYRDMFDVLTNPTLADIDEKTGVFEAKKLPF